MPTEHMSDLQQSGSCWGSVASSSGERGWRKEACRDRVWPRAVARLVAKLRGWPYTYTPATHKCNACCHWDGFRQRQQHSLPPTGAAVVTPPLGPGMHMHVLVPGQLSARGNRQGRGINYSLQYASAPTHTTSTSAKATALPRRGMGQLAVQGPPKSPAP